MVELLSPQVQNKKKSKKDFFLSDLKCPIQYAHSRASVRLSMRHVVVKLLKKRWIITKQFVVLSLVVRDISARVFQSSNFVHARKLLTAVQPKLSPWVIVGSQYFICMIYVNFHVESNPVRRFGIGHHLMERWWKRSYFCRFFHNRLIKWHRIRKPWMGCDSKLNFAYFIHTKQCDPTKSRGPNFRWTLKFFWWGGLATGAISKIEYNAHGPQYSTRGRTKYGLRSKPYLKQANDNWSLSISLSSNTYMELG